MALPAGLYGGGDAYTKTRGDVLIPELWADEIRRERDQELVMLPYMKAYSFEGKKADRVHIPIMHRVAVNTKAPETPVQFQARTLAEYVMDITQYKESSHIIEDLLEIQSQYDLRTELNREVGYALARDMNNFSLGLRAAINAEAAQTVLSTSDGTNAGVAQPLSEAAILAAKEILDLRNVPKEGRALLVGWQQYNALLTIEKFISMDFVSMGAVNTGRIGTLYDIPVIATSLIGVNSLTGYTNGEGATPQPTPGVAGSPYLPDQETETTAFTALPTTLGSGDAPTVSAMMVHPDWAIASVQKQPNMETDRSTELQADVMVSTQLYGMKTYRRDHGVIIHTTT